MNLRRAIGRLGDLLTLSGSAWIGARIEAEGKTLFDLAESYRGRGRIDGRAILSARENGDGALRLGAIRRLRDWLAKNFGGDGAAAHGSFGLKPGRLDLEVLKLEGRRAHGGGNAVLDFAAGTLAAGFAAYERGNGKPYLDIDMAGRLSDPDVRLGGRWISGE